MKYSIYLLILVGVIGCNDIEMAKHSPNVIGIMGGCEVITIDSCEYIGTSSGYIIHKQNCKFCKERNERWQYGLNPYMNDTIKYLVPSVVGKDVKINY